MQTTAQLQSLLGARAALADNLIRRAEKFEVQLDFAANVGTKFRHPRAYLARLARTYRDQASIYFASIDKINAELESRSREPREKVSVHIAYFIPSEATRAKLLAMDEQMLTKKAATPGEPITLTEGHEPVNRLAYLAMRRRRRFVAGMCKDCDKPRLSGRVLCADCSTKLSEEAKQRRAKRDAFGAAFYAGVA